MNDIKKAFLLFEQSGTFKNAFKAIGVDAYDYDVLDDFGETDVKIDIFEEIQNAYEGYESIFEEMNHGLVMAFFPCTYFSKMNIFIKKMTFKNYSTYSDRKKTELIIHRNLKSFLYLEKLLQLFQIAREKNIRLVVENPFSSESFLYRNRPFDPALIDSDRRDLGDYFQNLRCILL